MISEKVWKYQAAQNFNDSYKKQAEQISRLAMDLFQGKEPEGYDFENERYIFLPYQKVTAANVEEFLRR